MEFLLSLFIVFVLLGFMKKIARGHPLFRFLDYVFKVFHPFKFLSFITSSVYANRSTYGTAKFLKEWQANWLSENNSGVCINGKKNLSDSESTQHVLVVAPSGGGKTTIVGFPTIENISRHGGSMVITDPSSELHTNCYRMLEHRGFEVYKVDLSSPETSNSFNPILTATSRSSIDSLAKTLVTASMGGLGNDPYWNISAINLISLLIQIIKFLPEERQNLGQLKQYCSIIAVPELREEISTIAAENLPTDIFNEYLSFFAGSPKVVQSVISVAKAALSPVYENVDLITRSQDIDLKKLREGKAAIFVCIKENEQSKYGFLLNLFYEMVFDFCYEMPENPQAPYNQIYLILDEFANLDIQDMTSHITTLRKRKISILVILQSFSQLRRKYGQDADTIIGNTKTKIFMSGLDIDTCESLSRTIGMTTYTQKNNPFNIFEKGRDISRRLIQAEEIRRMDRDKILVIHGNENPLKIRAYPYYKNSRILKALHG